MLSEVVLINALTDASVYLLEFPPDERNIRLSALTFENFVFLSLPPSA